MTSINFVAWAPGVWADDVWALGVWEGELAGAGQVYGGGGQTPGGHERDDPQLIERLVREKWEAIDRARLRDAQQPPEPESIEPPQVRDVPVALEAQPAEAPAADAGPLVPMHLQMPGRFGLRMRPIAPVPVLPSTEMLLREAMERDDEEALLLILSQL